MINGRPNSIRQLVLDAYPSGYEFEDQAEMREVLTEDSRWILSEARNVADRVKSGTFIMNDSDRAAMKKLVEEFNEALIAESERQAEIAQLRERLAVLEGAV